MKSPIFYLWERLSSPRSWRQALRRVGRGRRRAKSGLRTFELDEALLEALSDLARRDRRSENEVAVDLLARGLAQRLEAERYQQLWETLTPRQKMVTALLCQGYSNLAIAERLRLSPQTVKSHVAGVLTKFGLSHRKDLNRVLAHWDFTEFLAAQMEEADGG